MTVAAPTPGPRAASIDSSLLMSGTQSVPPMSTLLDYRANGETVLVVDDEEHVRALLETFLARFGFKVMQASDGAAAVATFVANREAVKLVITDLRMPKLDGFGLIHIFRELAPTVPIIAMSGIYSELKVEEFAAKGVTQFLYKPFSVAELTVALRATMGEGARPA